MLHCQSEIDYFSWNYSSPTFLIINLWRWKHIGIGYILIYPAKSIDLILWIPKYHQSEVQFDSNLPHKTERWGGLTGIEKKRENRRRLRCFYNAEFLRQLAYFIKCGSFPPTRGSPAMKIPSCTWRRWKTKIIPQFVIQMISIFWIVWKHFFHSLRNYN